MKKLFYILIIPLLFSSCGKKELSKDGASKIISQYYHLPFQTKIAVDKVCDDYGWPPQKYNQLAHMGILYLTKSQGSIYYNSLNVQLTEEGQKYWLSNGIMNDPTKGGINMLIFKGYLVDIEDLHVSSNPGENTAEAEVTLKMYNSSPIQEIFDPLKANEIKKTVHFKLFNNGWEIIEDQESKNFVVPIVAPLHWMGGWSITYDNSSPDVITNQEINNISVANEQAAVEKAHLEQLRETSKIVTKTIGQYQNVDRFIGRPKSPEVTLTDVGIKMDSGPIDQHPNIWFGSILTKPQISKFTQTAFDWSALCIYFNVDSEIVFKDTSECYRFYNALLQALSEWRAKYGEVQSAQN